MVRLTESDREAMADILDNPLAFLSTFIKIPAKDRQLVPFTPWPVQERLALSMTGRDVTVKDTQCGSTSIYSGLFLVDTLTKENTTTVIVAHKEFATHRILYKMQRMYNSIPPWMRPKADHESSSEIRFPSINSVIYIATANAAFEGRGEPIHNVLFSEAAFYPPGAKDRIIIPTLQRVTKDGRAVLESTPHGEDEVLFPEVQNTLQGVGAYHLNVVYWWDNPDNQVGPDFPHLLPGDRGTLDLDGEEEQLQSLHGVMEDQLRWRRWRLREGKELFYQEHLESLDSCFLSTGLPYYDALVLKTLGEGCYPAPHTGPAGCRVWFPPEDGGYYIVGVDPGQGKVTESVASVWQVWPDRPPRHEATLSGWVEPLAFAKPVMEVAHYYRNALINPECNSHGVGLIALIRDYPNLYWRTDIISGLAQKTIGWLTGPVTKPFLMQTMARQLPQLETHDLTLVQQCRAYRDRGDGKAITVGLDDHHSAACLALVAGVAHTPSSPRGFKGASGWPW